MTRPRRPAALAAALLIALAAAPSVRGQVCPGPIGLTSQAAVDAFSCTSVTGNLTISGADVTDLVPLSALTSVGGQLFITDNAVLESLDGLSALASVGENLFVRDNPSLASLDGLSALASVGGALIIQFNDPLTSLDGFPALTSLGGLSVTYNAALTSIGGFPALTALGGNLSITDNAALTSVDGLSALTSISDDLFVRRNDLLPSLDGLSAVASVGRNLVVQSSPSLTALGGLSSLSSVGGFMGIDSNDALASLEGLSNLVSVGSFLIVSDNDVLPSLDGLSNLVSVSDLGILNNASLTSCAAGLAGLISGSPPAFTGVSGVVEISGNPPACSSPAEVLAASLVLNTPPTADAGPDQTVVVGQVVALDASGSSDPDGDPLTFDWTLEGPGGTAPPLSDAAAVAPSFCAATPGDYTATLVVDDGAATDEDVAVVTAVTAVEALGDAADDVEALGPGDGGPLNSGQVQALTRKLAQAARKVEQGKDPAPHLADFAEQVAAFVAEGVLTEEQAGPLTESAGAIDGAVAAPCSDGPPAARVANAGAPAVSLGLGAAPNPSRGPVWVRFELAEAADARLAVFDALGREVAVLFEGHAEAGSHAAPFDGSAVPAGAYVVWLGAGPAATALRLTVVR